MLFGVRNFRTTQFRRTPTRKECCSENGISVLPSSVVHLHERNVVRSTEFPYYPVPSYTYTKGMLFGERNFRTTQFRRTPTRKECCSEYGISVLPSSVVHLHERNVVRRTEFPYYPVPSYTYTKGMLFGVRNFRTTQFRRTPTRK